jgi:hypothetical protein
MGFPRVTAIIGSRAVWPPVGGVLLLLGAMLCAGLALAEDHARDFSATVKVDATADSAGAARDLARIDGQRRALTLVVDRLSGSSESGKLPKLDDKAITDMVESFEVGNERMSAIRYIADYTFHFRPSKVRRLVHVVDSAAADGAKPAAESVVKPTLTEGGDKPIVVLPVYRDTAGLVLWDDPNAWREAWGQRSALAGRVELSVPLGDASDLATIDAHRAASGKSDALTAIAQRNGGEVAVVALATGRRQDDKLIGLDLSVKRYRSGRLADTQGTTLDANPGESEGDFLKRAADTVAAEISSGSRKNPSPRSDQQATIAASVPLGNLGEWVQVRDRLASIPLVRRVELLSLSQKEAKIQIRYVGDPGQLKSSLAEVDLGLDGGDPLWRLQLSGATSLR